MKKIAFGTLLFTVLLTNTFAQTTMYYNTGTYCTQDAYVCPNGTTVGRTGPNCTFVCPSTNIPVYNNPSYTYTSGCYTYYYNGVTNTTTLVSNNCQQSYYPQVTYPYYYYYYDYQQPYYYYYYPYQSYNYYLDTWSKPTCYVMYGYYGCR